jgi:signal transduction histidine kinase/Na+/proline symporter
MITWVVLFGLLYLILLFFIANRVERSSREKQWVKGPWIHTLSLATFCSAWTYYGAVGRASEYGLDFLAVYIGPTIMLAISYGMNQKIFKISKQLHIASIADFISVRYGKSAALGALVTLCSIAGLVPYIALQIKGIVTSLEAFNLFPTQGESFAVNFSIVAIGTTLVIAVFSILYGARRIDPFEKHRGLMAVIAFESLFKLIVLLVIGVFIISSVFGDFDNFFENLKRSHAILPLSSGQGTKNYLEWMTMICLAGFAVLFLPRQFHINFVEGESESNLKHSTWSFPAYLFILSLTILPIAVCGLYLFGSFDASAETYVLAIPLSLESKGLAVLTWLGGLSAASGMIIMETIALSIMVSNNIVIPLFLTSYQADNNGSRNLSKILLIRRLSIIGILIAALIFYTFYAHQTSLMSIGLLSFGAVANFAPALIAGLYFKDVKKEGVLTGLVLGYAMWAFTSLVPQLADTMGISRTIMEHGLFGWEVLHPNALFGMNVLPPLAHSLFWSMGVNVLAMIVVSMCAKKTAQESYFADFYVEHQKYASDYNNIGAWKGKAHLGDLFNVLGNFIGEEKSKQLVTKFAEKNDIKLEESSFAPSEIVAFTERILSGVVGSSAARSLIKRTTFEEEISYQEMYAIIQDSQKVRASFSELKKKSAELEKAKAALQAANDELNQADQLKNEFLYTVTHELKTPLTSIIALSEIVLDNPDLDEASRSLYLQSAINEANRLANLINQVLRIEKFEAGKERLNVSEVDIASVIHEIANVFKPSLQSRGIGLALSISDSLPPVSCDIEMIKQVLVNLIGNAQKYASRSVSIATNLREGEIEIWVEDDGKGIKHSERELIFDKFFQAKNQSLRKPEGSGLGLAISKKIIDLHEGRIWVDTNFESGAHIAFSLPLKNKNAV